MKTAYDIVKNPIISEQSMEDLDLKKYVFEVHPDAGKIEIKRAIEQIFDVKVDKVNTINVKGKKKKTGRYPEGTRANWKKAIVKLKENSKGIEFFEGMV